MGIDIKKEILAESTLLKLNNLAAVIAIPDLLTPGISERICKIPIKIAFLNVKLLLMLLSTLNLSLTKSKIPNRSVVQAITSIFLIFSMSPDFTRIKPTKITGIEEIKILRKRNLFSKKIN